MKENGKFTAMPDRNKNWRPELDRNVSAPVRRRIITQTNFRDLHGQPIKSAKAQSHAIDDTDMGFKGVDFWNDIEAGKDDKQSIHEVVNNDLCLIELLSRQEVEGMQDVIYSVYTSGEPTIMLQLEVTVREQFQVRVTQSEYEQVLNGKLYLENMLLADVFVKTAEDSMSAIDLGGDYDFRILEDED